MTDPVIEVSFAEIDPAADAAAAIWIELLSRHGEVLARHRCSGPEVLIGRGYANDVVIDDPYVAAEHLRITRSADGRLVAQDLGSLNGTFVEREKARANHIPLEGDRRIRIGHTWLRIRDAAYAAAEERVDRPQRRLLPIAALMGALIIGIEVLTVWLNETSEPKLSRYLLTPLIVALVLLVWAGGWSVLSRIFVGRAKLERNLLIALGGALAYSLWNEFVWFFSFAFSSRALVTYGGIAFWLILALVCFLHLRAISPARPWAKAAGVLLLGLAGLGTQALTDSEGPGGSPYLAAPRRLMPPAFRVAPLVDRDAFAAALAGLKPKLDQQREGDAGDDADAEDGEG